MKEYAKRKLLDNAGEITANAQETSESLFITRTGETKDLELYDEKANLDYVKQLEDSYVEKEFSEEEKKRIESAGLGKKNSVKSQIKEERRAEFKHRILAQAQKSVEPFEANTKEGNLEAFATKLMLSLNYLSTQPFYKSMMLDKKMQDTAGMLGDIVRFGEKTLEVDETLFKATLYTITTMFGYVKKNLEELKAEVKHAFSDAEGYLLKGKGATKKMLSKEMEFKNAELKTLDDLTEGAGSIGDYIVRLESRGVEASRELLKGGENVKWHELFNSTFTSEVLEQNEVTDSGAGTSVVYKIHKGEQLYFFKGDENVGDPMDLVADMLETETVSKYVIRNFFSDKKDAVMEILNTFAYIMHYKNEYEEYDETKNKKEKDEAKAKLNENVDLLTNYFRKINLDIDAGDVLDIADEYGKAANALVIALESAELRTDDNLTVRNFATEHLAFLFGADELIVKSKDAVLQTRNTTEEGFVMESAVGIGIGEIYEKEYLVELAKYKANKISVEPQFLLSKKAMEQVSMLRFMDAVAGQIDRHWNNIIAEHTYDPETHTYVITSITGIDNDMAFGEHDDLSVLINDKTGKFYYDYCPRALFEAVKTITPELLRQNMANYVEPKYIDAMVKRFERLKIALLAKKAEMDRNKTMIPELADIFDNVEEYTSVFESPLMRR